MGSVTRAFGAEWKSIGWGLAGVSRESWLLNTSPDSRSGTAVCAEAQPQRAACACEASERRTRSGCRTCQCGPTASSESHRSRDTSGWELVHPHLGEWPDSNDPLALFGAWMHVFFFLFFEKEKSNIDKNQDNKQQQNERYQHSVCFMNLFVSDL